MNVHQTSEILLLGLLLAGALSTSYTLRSAANYAHFYEALANIELNPFNETYALGSEVLASIAFELQNPTPYHGMRLDAFSINLRAFQSSTTQMAMGLGSYTIRTLTIPGDVEVPAYASLTLAATFALKGDKAEQFRQFYQNQTGQIFFNYEAFVRLHTMLDNQCIMTLRVTPLEATILCTRTGSFGF